MGFNDEKGLEIGVKSKGFLFCYPWFLWQHELNSRYERSSLCEFPFFSHLFLSNILIDFEFEFD
jgi:hypothetical protein